jgi:hypothetical protein
MSPILATVHSRFRRIFLGFRSQWTTCDDSCYQLASFWGHDWAKWVGKDHLAFMQLTDTQRYLQRKLFAPTGPFQARTTVAV